MFDIGLNKHLPFWHSIQVELKAAFGTYPFITVRRMWDLPSESFQLDQLRFVVLGGKNGIFLQLALSFFTSQNVLAILASLPLTPIFKV